MPGFQEQQCALISSEGAVRALVWLAHNYSERTGIACHASREGEGEELPEDLRGMAYQCVREVLANVNKHAQATKAEISMTYVDQFLTILVEDDGVGFDLRSQEHPHELTKATHGFGLFSIRERLRSVDGRMLIDSKPGQGTRIFMSFPHGGSGGQAPAVPDAELFKGNDVSHG